MSSLKQSTFWVAFYLTAIMVLAQFDYFGDTTVIDFAKYFYITALLVVPVTVFVPSISKVNVFIPMLIWGIVYLLELQSFDRTSSNGSFVIVLLEFILVEAGVWLGYQLAYGISHAESVMDAMALTAFPNRTELLQDASKVIKTEITRCRRFHRPLGLLILHLHIDQHVQVKDMVISIQKDLWNRFSFARVGQVIDEHVRQTDMVFRDRGGRFVVLCPETNRESTEVLARRIVEAIEHRTNMQVVFGIADFPNDAINFDDLMDVAVSRIAHPEPDSASLHTQESVEAH